MYRPHPLMDTTAQLLSLRGDLSFRNICNRLEDCHDDNYFRHLPLSAMEELHKETLPPVQKDFNSPLSLINDS